MSTDKAVTLLGLVGAAGLVINFAIQVMRVYPF